VADYPSAWLPSLSTWMQAKPATLEGNYAGNNSANRAINHADGRVPRLVVIIAGDASVTAFLKNYNGSALMTSLAAAAAVAGYILTKMTGANFYVGNAASYALSMNATGTNYYWMAIY